MYPHAPPPQVTESVAASPVSEGRLATISVLLPAISAAATNFVLLVVALVKGDGTVSVVAAIGVLVAGSLAMVRRTQPAFGPDVCASPSLR
jgi:hypothetical protein